MYRSKKINHAKVRIEESGFVNAKREPLHFYSFSLAVLKVRIEKINFKNMKKIILQKCDNPGPDFWTKNDTKKIKILKILFLG